MSRRSVVWCWVVLALIPAMTNAQRRDPLQYIEILESAERVRKLQVEKVVERLHVKPASHVADLGAGSGLFSRPLARQVGPAGVVYAVDIDSELLSYIAKTARNQQLMNITTVLASEYDPRLPEKVDLVLICDTLHQIEDPGLYLRDLTRYLKKDGRVAVIDYLGLWPERFQSSRYTPGELDKWMRAAEFVFETRYDFLEDNFFVVYRFKPKEASEKLPLPSDPKNPLRP